METRWIDVDARTQEHREEGREVGDVHLKKREHMMRSFRKCKTNQQVKELTRISRGEKSRVIQSAFPSTPRSNGQMDQGGRARAHSAVPAWISSWKAPTLATPQTSQRRRKAWAAATRWSCAATAAATAARTGAWGPLCGRSTSRRHAAAPGPSVAAKGGGCEGVRDVPASGLGC